MKNLPDWAVRAVKTFVQAFLGVFIPAVIAVLNGGFPVDFGAAKVTLISALMAAIAAGISAAWNYVLEKSKEVDNLKKDE